eukprot:jgi/Mesvir1/27592/Mv07335-RA.1
MDVWSWVESDTGARGPQTFSPFGGQQLRMMIEKACESSAAAAMKFMTTCSVAWADVWPTYRERHLRPGPDADRALLHVEWRLGIPADPGDFRFSGACVIRVILHDGVDPANPPVVDDLHGVRPFIVDWRRFPGFLARVPLHPGRRTALLLEVAAVDGPVVTPPHGTGPLRRRTLCRHAVIGALVAASAAGRTYPCHLLVVGRDPAIKDTCPREIRQVPVPYETRVDIEAALAGCPGVPGRDPRDRLVTFLGAETVALATGFPDTKLLASHEAADAFFERLHPIAAGRVTSLVLYTERDVWFPCSGHCRCFQDVVRDVLFVGECEIVPESRVRVLMDDPRRTDRDPRYPFRDRVVYIHEPAGAGSIPLVEVREVTRWDAEEEGRGRRLRVVGHGGWTDGYPDMAEWKATWPIVLAGDFLYVYNEVTPSLPPPPPPPPPRPHNEVMPTYDRLSFSTVPQLHG